MKKMKEVDDMWLNSLEESALRLTAQQSRP